MATQIVIDPVTRIEGHLKIEVTVDTVGNAQEVVDAKATGTLFRGLEKVLVGRDPRDAHRYLSSGHHGRICDRHRLDERHRAEAHARARGFRYGVGGHPHQGLSRPHTTQQVAPTTLVAKGTSRW